MATVVIPEAWRRAFADRVGARLLPDAVRAACDDTARETAATCEGCGAAGYGCRCWQYDDEGTDVWR